MNPGNVLVGDEDGLIAFPPDQAQTLIERASAKLRQEQAIMTEIDGGAERQEWLHGTLRTLGLEM